MLIGMALYRSGVFSAERSTRFYATLIGVALAIGLPLVAWGIVTDFARGWPLWSFFLGTQLNYWPSIAVGLGYVGAVMLACRTATLRALIRPFAAVGRTALSNYLLQTVLCTTLFYGHGRRLVRVRGPRGTGRRGGRGVGDTARRLPPLAAAVPHRAGRMGVALAHLRHARAAAPNAAEEAPQRVTVAEVMRDNGAPKPPLRRARSLAHSAGSQLMNRTKPRPTASHPTRDEAVAALTAPGAEFELATETIGGVEYRVFRNLPTSLRSLYDQARKDHGEKDFLVFEDTRLTYSEAWDRAAAVAHQLVHRYRVEKGDRVAIGMRNYPEWVIAFMAITSCGAISVSLNGWWSGEELEYGLKDCGAKLVFLDQAALRAVGRPPSRARHPRHRRTLGRPASGRRRRLRRAPARGRGPADTGHRARHRRRRDDPLLLRHDRVSQGSPVDPSRGPRRPCQLGLRSRRRDRHRKARSAGGEPRVPAFHPDGVPAVPRRRKPREPPLLRSASAARSS